MSSLLVFFLLSANSGFTQISISGSSNVCPQIDLGTNNYTYTVNNLPSGSAVSAFFQTNFFTPGFITKTSANTFKVEYASKVNPFSATLIFRVVYNSGQLVDIPKGVNVSVNSPGPINGGNILVCPNGPNVSLTTNTSLGCGFHCQYVWTAPSGVTLQYFGNSGNLITVNPSQLPNFVISRATKREFGATPSKSLVE